MRIAVVGAGVSGLTAAHLLAEEHQVVVFEAEDRPGGHTHTVDVELEGRTYPVDTGFIVFNRETYPHFVRLMERLGVESQDSDMSFSASSERPDIEYKPSGLNALFAQRRNLVRPGFHRMLRDALRFRRESARLLQDRDEQITLGQYLEQGGYSREFRDWFLIPMGAAIWSAPPRTFLDFPARYFVDFFTNHGFLRIRNQPQWLVIRGGSRTYLEPLMRPFRDGVRTGRPVESVRRLPSAVEVVARGAEPESFDQVILALHSDQALEVLADPSDREREILGAIPYQENETVLHTDPSLLPRRRAAWASWNYRIPPDPNARVVLTYHMNRLQTLDAPAELCVTLNATSEIDPQRILRRLVYHHPLYAPAARAAQKRHAEISGTNRTHYCGAYWGYGFHEDGVRSAVTVAAAFGRGL